MVADGNGGYTMIGDVDPLNDVCSTAAEQVTKAGKNIGDLLNAAKISWGAFMGGFDLSATNRNSSTGCTRVTNPTVANYPYNSTRLYPAPCLVPVLRQYCQSHACPAQCGGSYWQQFRIRRHDGRAGQSSIRLERFLRRAPVPATCLRSAS